MVFVRQKEPAASMEELARNIMKYEIGPALLIENPDYGKYINEFISSFIERCRYSFSDKSTRVGRDVLRKLQNGERIIGAILCCVLEKFPSDDEAEKVKALYEANYSVADVLAYDGAYNRSKYKGLDREQDNELITRIQSKLDELVKSFTP